MKPTESDLPESESDADLEALSVTPPSPDDGPPPPVKRNRKLARVTHRVRRLTGTPTPEEIAAVLRIQAEKHGPDPQTIIAARIMFLNGSKPKAICSALKLQPKWLTPFWASWVAEKAVYSAKIQSDAWTVGRTLLEQALTSIIEEDLKIGGVMRAILTKALKNISDSVAAGQPPDTKALADLVKVYSQNASVTHKMAGIGAKQDGKQQSAADLWPVRPVAPIGPAIDVPFTSSTTQ